MDNFDNADHDVRNPDNIITDQLLDDKNDFEKQIDEAIYLSMQEFNDQIISYSNYETQLLKEFNDETNRRNELFKDFLLNLNKISKYDKEIREIYYIIEPIITSYCSQYIQQCELDEETYNKIFTTLKNIRNNQLCIDTLKTIILREIL